MAEGFGWSVAISGDIAVIGAVYDFGDVDGPSQWGSSAYVFARSGSTWALAQMLSYPINELFGTSVAISGDTAVVGAPLGWAANVSLAGSAEVFVRSSSGWDWQATLLADTLYTGAGTSVAISGDTVIFGAPWDATTVNPRAPRMCSSAPVPPGPSSRSSWPAMGRRATPLVRRSGSRAIRRSF